MKTLLTIAILLASCGLAFGQGTDPGKLSPDFVKAARRAVPLIREGAVVKPRDLTLQCMLRMADAEAEIQTNADQAVFSKMQEADEGKWNPRRIVICAHEIMVMLKAGTVAYSEACGDKSQALPSDLQHLIPDQIK
jgi:hypothetical protein